MRNILYFTYFLLFIPLLVKADISRPLGIEDGLAIFSEIQSTAYNNNLEISCNIQRPYDPDILGCGNNTEEIRSAHGEIEGILNSWSDKIEYYRSIDEVLNNRSHEDFLKDMEKKIQCMRRRIPSSHYTCYDRDSCDYARAMAGLSLDYTLLAFVEVRPKKLFGIIPWWGNSYSHEVGLCPALLRINEYDISTHDTYLRGHLIHELSHKCGTKDLGYYNDPLNSVKFDKYSSEAADRADNYRYWEANGLCIPNFDC